MVSINNFILKKKFYQYEDKSSFSNYEKIAKTYNKIYYKLISKKFNNINKEKLRETVKKWFFTQSLENRIKISTVENEFFGKIIYQMYLYYQKDSTIKFMPKSILVTEDETEMQLSEELLNDSNLDIYFQCKSERIFINGIYCSNDYFDYLPENNNNNHIDTFLKEINFFSAHQRQSPDCFSLSPDFLLKEELFENSFRYCGNIDFFTSLIIPFYNPEKKIYGYKLPNWFEKDNFYSISEYIIAFLEQNIMIKFLLDMGKTGGETIFSLINEQNLSRTFTDRNMIINYLEKNYNKSIKKSQLLNDININKIITNIYKNDKIMAKIFYFKNISKQYSCDCFYGSVREPLINNIYITSYDYDIPYINSSYGKNERELNAIRLKNKINELLERSDNIKFVDYLLFQNLNSIWKFEFFVNLDIIESVINLQNEINFNDLINDFSKTNVNQSKKRKKKHKNKETKKETNIYNKTSFEFECYNELFKDENKAFWAPYYISTNIEIKAKYDKIKKNKIKNFEDQTKKIYRQEIINFIKNEILLKTIIDKAIHLQPDNYVSFFGNNNSINNDEEKCKKINLFKLKPKNTNKNNNDDFGSINLFTKENDNKNNFVEKIKTDNIANINITNENKKKMSSINIIENNLKIIEELNNQNPINSKNKSSNKQHNKKKEKEQNFFLFDTINKSKNIKKQKKSLNQTQLEFPLISLKDTKQSYLSFTDKLHNQIIKYENKVNNILQMQLEFKNFCLNEVKKIISNTFENKKNILYDIDIYGSFTTGLMIESSDIDINIKIHNNQKKILDEFFFELNTRLNKENKFELIMPISTASVPIIKLIIDFENFLKNEKKLYHNFQKFKESPLLQKFLFDKNELFKIKIDISFTLNTIIDNHETSSVSYIKEQIQQFPEVKFILKVLKRYFYIKKMNSSFIGGLSSYNLFLMILSFAKYQRIPWISKKTLNLGCFLIQFLSFFANIFDFKNYLINVNSPNIYELINDYHIKEFNAGKSLVIIEPLTGTNSSKSSYKIDEIQKTFLMAINFFEKEKILYEEKENNPSYKEENNGILGLSSKIKNENNMEYDHHGTKKHYNIIEKFFFS